MITDNPILITGIPRSGSSIIANIITLCGAFNGECTKMQVNSNVRKIVANYFDFIGKNEQYPLPVDEDVILLDNWKKKIDSAILLDGYLKGPWMYKDSHSGLIWPLWNNAYPKAKWIIVRRRTGDIVYSCLRTAYMNAFKNMDILNAINRNDERAGWLWWIHQYEKHFIHMLESGLNCRIVWPERMAMGDYEEMIETVKWCGLEWNPKLIPIVNLMLQNSKQKERE